MTANSPLLIAVVAGLLGIFGGGTVVALFRVNADKQRVIVDAAQGAVIVQTGVIDNLRDELHRVQALLTNMQSENRALQQRMARLEREIRRGGLEIPNGV